MHCARLSLPGVRAGRALAVRAHQAGAHRRALGSARGRGRLGCAITALPPHNLGPDSDLGRTQQAQAAPTGGT